MSMPGMALAGRNFGAIIAQLDAALQEAQDGARVQLLLNRGFCLQQLGLSRKALKASHMCLGLELSRIPIPRAQCLPGPLTAPLDLEQAVLRCRRPLPPARRCYFHCRIMRR
jgi:hypothetical protein